MGIGMSNEIDSNMAAQAMMWAFGGSIQDENENVVINSPENDRRRRVHGAALRGGDDPRGLRVDRRLQQPAPDRRPASYILNSISAYRTAQEEQPQVAPDIFFGAPLVGPAARSARSPTATPSSAT